MARKKTEAETKEEQAHADWKRIREAAGEAAGSVAVFRMTNGKRGDYLAAVDPDTFTHDPYEYLAQQFGGGEYLCVLRDAEAGTFLPQARVRFRLAGKPKTEEDATAAELAAVEKKLEELTTKGGGAADSALLVELIRQQGQLTRDLMKAPADTGPSIVEIVGALTPLLAPVLERLMEPKDSTPPPSTMDRLEELTTLMDLARGMQGPTDGLGTLARTLGEPISKLVEARVNGAPGAPGPGQPPAGAIPSTTGAGDMPQRPAWYQMLAPMMPQAMQWAERGANAELRGEFILDELPDSQIGIVYETLTAPEFRGAFFSAFPAAAEHSDWFDTLFRTIVAGIQPEEEIAGAEAIAEAKASTGGLPLEAPAELEEEEGPTPPPLPLATEEPTRQVERADVHSLG